MAKQHVIRKTFQAAETKQSASGDRRLIVTISTANPDRSKDVVVPKGMVAENYNRNPVVAAFHRYDQPAIGKTVGLQVTDGGIVAEVEFAPKGIYPLADQLYELYKSGFMNAWSIGFIPQEATDLDPNSFGGGKRFDKWELLEYSAVLVPDNPDALTMLRSKGIDIDEDETKSQDGEAEVDTKQLEKLSLPTTADDPKPDPEPIDVEIPEVKALRTELAELKEGRVLSGDNRRLVTDTVNRTKEALAALEALMSAKVDDPDPQPQPDPQPEKSLSPEGKIRLEDALKVADKALGKALRDLKRTKEN